MNKAEKGKWKNGGSHWEQTLGHHLQPPVLLPLSYDNQTTISTSQFSIYYTNSTECFSRASGSHYICAIRTLLGVNWKHYWIGSKAIQVVCNNATAKQICWYIIITHVFISYITLVEFLIILKITLESLSLQLKLQCLLGNHISSFSFVLLRVMIGIELFHCSWKVSYDSIYRI